MFGQMVFEGGRQLPKKWVCDSWDDDANDVCLTPQQCPSDLIRPVVQLLDCVRNLVFGLLAEVTAIVEDPGDGGRRNTRKRRHVSEIRFLIFAHVTALSQYLHLRRENILSPAGARSRGRRVAFGS